MAADPREGDGGAANDAATTRRVADHGATIECGGFLLSNNLWGAASGRGTQSLWAGAPGPAGPAAGATEASPAKRISWGTKWAWEGDPDTVKSYVACTLGWHWGWPLAGGPLPAPLDGLAAAISEWRFRLAAAPGSRLNVAYDIWLASAADPVADGPSDEVMLWLAREGGPTPIGRPVGEVALEGALWELWRGPHPERRWTVHSLVRRDPVDSVRLDLARFLQALRPAMPTARYLVGVEAGTEVFLGSGRLDTSAYSLGFVTR